MSGSRRPSRKRRKTASCLWKARHRQSEAAEPILDQSLLISMKISSVSSRTSAIASMTDGFADARQRRRHNL